MTPRTATVAGWTLAGVAAVFAVVSTSIDVTGPGTTLPPSIVVLLSVLPLAFSLVGALIVSRRPDNRLGWLFAIGGVITAASSLTYAFAEETLTVDAGSTAGRVAAWITDILNPLSLGILTVFLFLLFPAGRLGSRSGRRVAVVASAGISLAMVGAFVEPTLQEVADIPAPFAPAIPKWIPWTLFGLGFAALTAALVASIVLLVVRLRRSKGRERNQLRILVWAAAAATVLLLPALLTPTETPAYRNIAYTLGGMGFLLIPISVGVAILRHRLLDIDLVIRRTVVVALLGGFITLVYVGVVVGIGALVGSSGNAVLSPVAAAVVALAFQPVRRWGQRLANRFVYGKRATPYEVMHDFSERVAGSYGTEDVLPRMATILGEGTGAERAQVWLRAGSELRPAAAWPPDASRSEPMRADGTQLPDIPDVSHAVAVRDRNELLGALSVTKPASEPVTPTEEKLVADLALQAGLVMRNVRLVEDLRASRGRLVAAQDQERRKLERNIHDGAQQQLVALAVKAKLADTMVDRDPSKAHALMAEVVSETQEALESLRDLARGIYPPLLADEGLTAALGAQARKSPMPVTVESDEVGRYPQEIEATVYFCVLEALQNAAKYSEASSVRITLGDSDGTLSFEVADDGRGFDVEATGRGAGLQNMADRLDALGGRLEIASTPSVGTRLVGRLPV